MASKQLHPGAKWLFRVNAIFGGIIFALIISSWVFGFFNVFNGDSMVGVIVTCIVFFLIVLIVLVEVYARFSYRFWLYEFTQDQLRIERGIIWKKYSNIPYQRIQNVDITRGVVARICGFSSVNLQTAGYSMPARGSPSGFSEGYLPAVSIAEAEQIREMIIKKISKRKGSGL